MIKFFTISTIAVVLAAPALAQDQTDQVGSVPVVPVPSTTSVNVDLTPFPLIFGEAKDEEQRTQQILNRLGLNEDRDGGSEGSGGGDQR